MTLELQANEMGGWHNDEPDIRIKLGAENMPELNGWELRYFSSGYVHWMSLFDADGNDHGSVCIDMIYLTNECLEMEAEAEDPNGWFAHKLGHPQFIIDDADHGDQIVYVSTRRGEEPLVSLETGVELYHG